MTEASKSFCLPKSIRIISTDDFGKILKSAKNTQLKLGRDAVSVSAIQTENPGRVRFGFTVGKHNVPRSVDRALAKRILREVARHAIPDIRKLCVDEQVGIDINLRVRSPLGKIGTDVSVRDIKSLLRLSAEKCITALKKRMAVMNKEIASAS